MSWNTDILKHGRGSEIEEERRETEFQPRTGCRAVGAPMVSPKSNGYQVQNVQRGSEDLSPALCSAQRKVEGGGVMSRLELAALDALCCALDDERPRAVVTARAWGEFFSMRVPRGEIHPHKLMEPGATPGPATSFDRQDNAVSSVPALPGTSLASSSVCPASVIDCAAPVVAPPAGGQTHRPASDSGGMMPLSKPHGCGPVSSPVPLCVWCALERALSGQAPAPRINGDVWLRSCARHEERPGLPLEVLTTSPTVRRAAAPAADLGRAPNGSPNPNAGHVPHFPRGRWS